MSASMNDMKFMPKDAQIIMAILEELGIDNYDPRVVNHLLEYIFWQTTTILDDALVFANHAKRKNIDVDDVRLAVETQAEQMSSAAPPREILFELCKDKNSTVLSPIKPQSGVRLPPDRCCFTQKNQRLKSNLPSVLRKSFTSNVNMMNVSKVDSIQHTSSHILTQMPSRTLSAPLNVSDKSSLSETSNALDELKQNNLSHSETKTDVEIDLMEIDSLSSHI